MFCSSNYRKSAFYSGGVGGVVPPLQTYCLCSPSARQRLLNTWALPPPPPLPTLLWHVLAVGLSAPHTPANNGWKCHTVRYTKKPETMLAACAAHCKSRADCAFFAVKLYNYTSLKKPFACPSGAKSDGAVAPMQVNCITMAKRPMDKDIKWAPYAAQYTPMGFAYVNETKHSDKNVTSDLLGGAAVGYIVRRYTPSSSQLKACTRECMGWGWCAPGRQARRLRAPCCLARHVCAALTASRRPTLRSWQQARLLHGLYLQGQRAKLSRQD